MKRSSPKSPKKSKKTDEIDAMVAEIENIRQRVQALKGADLNAAFADRGLAVASQCLQQLEP